jgi:threonylcarbamoyladenosine tRNA methylthiotransferase MtaB
MRANKKAALHNLGCKVNAYETEAMQQLLTEAGFEIVPFSEKADVYVINTCSVTNMADRKSRQMLHRAKKLNPDSVVVAAGCYVQTKENEAAKDDAIDILIGNNRKGELLKLLLEFFEEKEGNKKLEAVPDINHTDQGFEELPQAKPTEHTRAFLKVQDGCNQFCSYCIIPYARGRVRSRERMSVIKEVESLAKSGYREVVLTGIHLSSYGTDCGDDLLSLIKSVHEVDGIDRIRLGSLEPRIVTVDFASELSKMNKVCPHFHLSLQSGCDATLARMNRKYTAAEYEKACGILRKNFVHPAITTDVIVGFPGETEEEFKETEEFLKRIHFYEMHIFKYSRREGTRAAVMENQIPEEIKTKRSARLISLADEMSKEFRDYYIGRTEEVLFEEANEIDGKLMYTGYTREYVRVAAESDVPLDNCLREGKITGRINKETYYIL